MMGVFVQLNTFGKCWKKAAPIGYVIQENGCWEWVGNTSKRWGYGQWTVGKKKVRAHRWTYEQAKGPIPEGLELDHLCRNRACVNPDHLEAVTRRENQIRGHTLAAANVKKTHCPSGHEYNERNTSINKKGHRKCRTCINLRSKRYYAAGYYAGRSARRTAKIRAQRAAWAEGEGL